MNSCPLREEQDLLTIRRGVWKQGGVERVEHRGREASREGDCSVGSKVIEVKLSTAGLQHSRERKGNSEGEREMCLYVCMWYAVRS